MNRFITLLFLYTFLPTALKSQPAWEPSAVFSREDLPKREVRAVWLTTIGGLDWPHSYAQNSKSSIAKQQEELISTLDRLQAAGINTVLLQTRIRGTVIYPSALEPWDGCLSGSPGVSPGYDALKFAVEECHKRGMELHAWVVTIPVGKWNSKGCATLRKKYPTLIKKIGDEGYMNPEDSRTATILADICGEITRYYDIDGIHLDYIRYPEDWKGKVDKRKGRQQITDIVRKIHSRVKSLKPWVKMSCSPIGKYDDLPRQSSRGWNARSRVMQDAQLWLREGLMDEIFPMMYFQGNNFYPFAIDWQEQSAGRIVAPGLGIYLMSPREGNWSLKTITQEMQSLRWWGMGYAFFRSRFLTDDTKGILSFTKNEFNRTLALVPAMTWESSSRPTPPEELITDSLRGTLSWSGAQDRSGGPNLTYNIYCSNEWPVDVSRAENLVATRVERTSVMVPLKGKYYAVTAMDRYGNESEPRQNIVLATGPKPGPKARRLPDRFPMFECDGKRVFIGKTEANNSDLIQIETMQGTALKTAFMSKSVDVRDLPEGFYTVRSIGKKKSSHRLGYFEIRRHETTADGGQPRKRRQTYGGGGNLPQRGKK